MTISKSKSLSIRVTADERYWGDACAYKNCLDIPDIGYCAIQAERNKKMKS